MHTPPKLTLYAQNDCHDFVFNLPFSLFQAQVDGKALFDFSVCSDSGRAIMTEFGAKIAVQGNLTLMDTADIIVIAGWVGDMPSRVFVEKLQSAHQNGKKIIGLCYGTFGLGYAGILAGRTVVTHWAGERAFRELFADIALDGNRLYIDDDNILTSAGASAGLDCCLYFIRTLYGVSVANHLARVYVSAPHREGGQAQFVQMPVTSHTKDDKINELLDFLSKNLADTHRLDELADRVHLSKRSFNRHFKNATNMTLSEWLIAKRLAYAQECLEMSDDNMELIAQKAGFGTASNLRMQFKDKFGVSPQAWRRSFGGG